MTKRGRIAVIMAVILGLLVIGGIYVWRNQPPAEKSSAAQTEATASDDDLHYNGKTYKYNTDLDVMLFMGVDKKQQTRLMDHDGHGGQSDCLMLLVTDQKKKSTQLIAISRDTMTEIKVYGMNGDYVGPQQAQIALQFAYGDGKKRSAQLTKETVAGLLHDIPIRSYMALDIAGIPGIVDQIGGVPITVGGDYTKADPAFQKGAQLVLNGSQAYTYVQKRDTTTFGSNNERMQRQSEFIQAFFQKISTMKSKALIEQLMKISEPYMTTNMDVDDVEKLSDTSIGEEIVKFPGQMKAGEHDELYLDEDGFMQILTKYLYKEK